MKITLLFFLLLITGNLFSQDSPAAWIQNTDTSEFEVFYHKKHLPKGFYKIQGIKKPGKIANPDETYSPSCLGPMKGQLHWVAKQDKKWVICITKGSSAVMTIVYCLDYSARKLTVYSTTSPVSPEMTFGEFLDLLKSGERKLEELDSEHFN